MSLPVHNRPASAPGASPAISARRAGPVRRLASGHPILTFLILAVVPTWATQGVLLYRGLDLMPGILAELVYLLAAAVLVTHWTSGGPGVRRLLAGVLRWRIGPARFLLVLGAVPLLTLAVAAATGDFHPPADGWTALVVTYLVKTVVLGALLGNVWEETAWTGVVQARLMRRYGLLAGSVLTAVPFALIHLPFAFQEHGLRATTAGQAAVTFAMTAGAALIYRYLIGTVFADTGGSLLAVGLLHASWNASGSLAAVDGPVPSIVATVLLTLLAAAYRTIRRSRPTADASSHQPVTAGAPAFQR
jgi:uncharacterized protein